MYIDANFTKDHIERNTMIMIKQLGVFIIAMIFALPISTSIVSVPNAIHPVPALVFWAAMGVWGLIFSLWIINFNLQKIHKAMTERDKKE